MKRVDQIITSVRDWTENQDYGSTAGISQDRIAEAIADAQDMLQGAILRANPDCRWFDATTSYSLTAGDRDLQLPSRCYYGDNIRLVEFSETGSSDYYVPLEPVGLHQIENASSWPPNNYALSGTQIILSPSPSSSVGTVRVTYVKRLPRLDRPRGIITSLVSTSLTLNNEATFLDSTGITAWVPGYFSITRRLDGANVVFSVSGSAYNSSTRVITVGTPTYETGFSSSDLADNFITFGDYTTCIPAWPSAIQNEVERYLKCYAIWKIMRSDSSLDATEQGNELSAIESDIIQAASSANGDYRWAVMDSCDW